MNNSVRHKLQSDLGEKAIYKINQFIGDKKIKDRTFKKCNCK